MAETLISPGVFLTENDMSQITQGPIAAGAALIGPTVFGPVNIPTVVTSYSEYKALFGTAFISGGTNYEYLTSIAALNYFEQGGTSLLITRVVSGSYTPAIAEIPCGIAGKYANASATPTFDDGAFFQLTGSSLGRFYVTSSRTQIDSAPNYYVVTGSTATLTVQNIASKINSLSSIFNIIATGSSTNLFLTSSLIGTIGNSFRFVTASSATNLVGGVNPSASFVLETVSVGQGMDNWAGTGSISNQILPSGSNMNIRWEVVSSNSGSGVFSLIIRRGDDYSNSKTILETWNGLSLDPNQPNYIAAVIGDQTRTVQTDEFGNSYLQLSGNYRNVSRYVRVKSVNYPTPNYFDGSGTVQSNYTASMPLVGLGLANGAFSGSLGPIYGCYEKAALNMFEAIPTVTSVGTNASTNIQGISETDYSTAISLLSNQDAYDFNVLFAPGLNSQNATSTISSLISLSQTRGDNISIVDMTSYGQSMTQATIQAQSYDNSYAAVYWPWVQIRSRETGKLNFVPASTLIPAIYEYNDKVSAEWFAPAGSNRGKISIAIKPERSLTLNDRNFLYSGKVNPIAIFPTDGVVVYGQKTLQAKASALDRVNVRRLLISLKRAIKQISENLVFEPNTTVTRNKFLNQVNPYLEYVQQKQGLYSFQVVMDETNNTPDVIDRNQLVGAIYLQPTKVAEFVQLDFNILPTGATFGQ